MQATRPLFVLAFGAALFAAVAQDPNPKKSQQEPQDLALVSAEPMIGQTLWRRAALEEGPLEAKIEAGIVRDFVIHAKNGTFDSVVVEPKATGRAQPPRIVPMAEVRYDAATNAMWTDLDPAAILARPEYRKQEVVLQDKQPGMRAAFLLTELCGIQVACPAAKRADKERKEQPEEVAKPQGMRLLTVWYVATGGHEAAFATVQQESHKRLVPWSLLSPSCDNGIVAVHSKATAEAIAKGPEFVASTKALQPDDALRHAAYRHYDISSPAWDKRRHATEASAPGK